MAGIPGVSQAPLGNTPPNGQSYINTSNGHVMVWQAGASLYNPQGAMTGQSPGKYLDTGQVDPSWQAQQNREQAVSALNSLLGGSGGVGGAGGATVSSSSSGSGGAFPTVSPIPPVAASPVSGGTSSGNAYSPAATAAAFTQAKDTTGLAVQGALKSLQNVMAERGLTGSGIEAGQTEKLVGSGLEDIAGETAAQAGKTSDQAFQASQQGNELGEQTALANQGNATNVGEFNANLNEQQQQLALQRSQDIANSTAQRLNSLVSAYTSLY